MTNRISRPPIKIMMTGEWFILLFYPHHKSWSYLKLSQFSKSWSTLSFKEAPKWLCLKTGYIYIYYIYKWIRGHFNREDGWTCWRTIVGIAYFQTTPNGLIYPSIHVIWLELGSYISHEMFIDIGRSKMPFSDAFCYGYDTSSLKYPSYSQLPSGILI